MTIRKSEYVLVAEQLKSIREKIKNLRHTSANNVAERIIILRKINQLLTESNDLLIIRQRLLEERNNTFEKRIDILESRLE